MILKKNANFYLNKTTKVSKTFVVVFILLFNFNQLACNTEVQSKSETHTAVQNKFKLGNEVLLDRSESIKGKRIGLLTNQTGILSDGTHIIDAMIAKGFNVVKIFTPEHGIRGDENYAEVDQTGIPIVSIYGGKTKPSSSDLSDVDVIVYDIQDVGARFYTYTSTLYYIIEAAQENGKELIVCDRPMVINPNYVDGFIMEPSNSSFVGLIPTPICYGMTCGELAQFLSGSVLRFGSLNVIKMENYTRSTEFNSLKLAWVKPSPSMFTSATALCYPATCMLEGTNISEGRGTDKPFEYFGAPWMDANAVASELNSYGLKGVTFEATTFTPSEKISAYPPKFFNKECNGIYINVTDKNAFEPVTCGTAILTALKKLAPEFKFNKDNFIDKLAGSDEMRKQVNGGAGYESIVSLWAGDVTEFKNEREKYLIYK